MPSLFNTIAYNVSDALNSTTFRAVIEAATESPYFDDPNATTTAAPPPSPPSDNSFDWVTAIEIGVPVVFGIALLICGAKALSRYKCGLDEFCCESTTTRRRGYSQVSTNSN